MRKVLTIVGTRPELIKMSRVISALDAAFDHVLVHTGQNYDYELNEVFFKDLDIRRPDHFLNVAAETPAESIANIIRASDVVLAQEQPEAVLIYGDTNSGLACIPAKRRKIPIFHFEAGNRCFDARVPEEINRRIIDHTSDINVTLTEHARRYLLAEGLPADRVFNFGSHMQEVLRFTQDGVARSDVLDRLGLSPQGYFLVSAHREENVDRPERLRELLTALTRLAEIHRLPVLVSTHPRTRARMEAGGLSPENDTVRFSAAFGFFDYIRLQQGAACVISDSGTISEEAALLNLPAVSLRDAHERPEGVDAGVVTMSTVKTERLLEAVAVAMATHAIRPPTLESPAPDYNGGALSNKIVRLVSGYIDIVNNIVWSKDQL